MYCAPRQGNTGGSRGGCFDQDALIRISRTLGLKTNGTDVTLWNNIRDYFVKQCGNDETCWLEQPEISRTPGIDLYHKPEGPSDSNRWLKSSELDHVMRQYESVYDDFRYMGAVPIDFDKILDEFMTLDFCRLYHNGIRRMGFIFNLDTHDQSGSHWVSMFLNITDSDPYIGFFDSFGECPPPPEISKLMTRLKSQIYKCLGITVSLKCNKTRHQRKNTECGVYSLYFIYQSLMGKSFEYICDNIISDEEVARYRTFFFRPEHRLHGGRHTRFDLSGGRPVRPGVSTPQILVKGGFQYYCY